MSEKRPDKNTQPRLLNYLGENWVLFRPFIVGGATFLILFFLIREFRNTELYLQYLSLIAQWTSALVNAFGIQHSMHSVSGLIQDMIRTDVVNVEWTIDSSSDGLIVLAMVVSAIFAIRGTALRRIVFLLLGVAICFALAPLAIALGIFNEQHFPLQQMLLNDFLVPLVTGFVPIIAIVIAWYKYSGKDASAHA